MTSITRKVFSTLKTAYGKINSSTLNGAIDIIVVQQEDGTLRCTPFHVRFGKLGVLQSVQNKVYITINGNAVEDLYMQLGEAGEAVFIEENTGIANIQPIRHLEPSDNSTFLDPDNAINLFPGDNAHSHLSIIDCSPQIINSQLDQAKPHGILRTPENYISKAQTKPKVNIDVLNSNTIVSTPRRPKRRLISRLSWQTSEDDERDGFNESGSSKRLSRGRKRDSILINTPSELDPITTCSANERFRTSIKLLRKRSASENDLPLFQFDFKSAPFPDTNTRFHSIDSRPKTLRFNETDQNGEIFSPQEEENNKQKNSRTVSNPINMEQIYDSIKATEESDKLNSSVLSKSAPSENLNTTNLLLSQSSDPTEDFYSPTSSYQNPSTPRPTSPKSDTEYELEKSSEQSTNVGWRWKWGELPEQRQSVFQYLWPSSKKTAPKEGIYLEDITSNRVVDPSRYLPQLDYHQHRQRTMNDDDQESGTGNSIPHSPFREHEGAYNYLLGDAHLSLCGNINNQSAITDEIFNAHFVSFETFSNNPAIIHDPNLVVRINNKFYNWSVASALIISASIFHKPLPTEVVEQLQEKHMAQTKPRTTGGGWWPSFYGKKSDMKTESPKVTSPITATDVLGGAAKSEVVPTVLSRHDSTESIKSQKTSKSDNDSEQEDSEVRKLTASMEKEKAHQQRPPSTHSAHQMTLKKTMILSSDQLKRLNLKLGMNKVEFSVTTALQGTTIVKSNIFLFDHMTKFVISDIDGTITKSDVLGHIIPLVGGDWSHDGIAEFFNAIQENGYQFIYLSARAIGQSQITRNFLRNIKQSNRELPSGPLLISPDTLMTALYREVIAKKPEDFKIECLKNIASLFPGKNPFYAGFGNRINDQWAYTAVGIPVTRIYTINPRGEVIRQKLSQALSTSYKNLHEIVDLLFPPMDSFSASETYSVYTYWREEPGNDAFEEEMLKELEEIVRRQRATKSNSKTKGTSVKTPTTSILPRTTPTTTVVKSGGEPLLTIAQATENTVKRA